VLLLVQVPPLEVELKVVVDPIQISWVPLRVPATGGAVTVIVPLAVILPQPPVRVTV
jgi:hypothetical protein